ncbi:MAG TPA: chaperone modulator CbpM [Acidiferrobacter sp.]|nr:chaperone modulator CbpM [Acidiferrobacter sp.]
MKDALVGMLLDELANLTRADLCGSGRLTAEDLDILVALGLVSPRQADSYPASSLHRVRRAVRLKQGLDADWEIVALIMDLLHEIDALKAQVRHLEAASLSGDVSSGDED